MGPFEISYNSLKTYMGNVVEFAHHIVLILAILKPELSLFCFVHPCDNEICRLMHAVMRSESNRAQVGGGGLISAQRAKGHIRVWFGNPYGSQIVTAPLVAFYLVAKHWQHLMLYRRTFSFEF